MDNSEPANSRPEIELRSVSKKYGDFEAIKDFSLTIERGEFVTAIGSSGCGKTTVLKLMNGLLTPDNGSIFVQGRDISKLDQNMLRRRIGYVIQGIGLFPHMRVADNITYVLRLNRTDKQFIEQRLAELADIAQIDSALLSHYPHELSGGQRQRVGIARALAAEPSIMLMDEPFGAVDEITRKALQKEFKRIHTRLGMTVFFITHDINEALMLGDRVVVMNDGVIEQYGHPDELRARPGTEFVQKLLGW